MGNYHEGLFYPFLDTLLMRPDQIKSEDLGDMIPKSNNGDLEYRLEGLLGLGGGLTPSGDDFICGYLLAVYYLMQRFDYLKTQNNVTNRLTSKAHAKTTSLSATLIRCAAQGKADERVLNALRWIAGGVGEIDKINKELQSYGSSSGVDTLAGMLAALLLYQNHLVM